MIARALNRTSTHSLSELCRIAGVSRSGFYSWLKRPVAEVNFEELLVVDLFELKKGKYGIRKLKMYLEKKTGLIYNLKRIIRIKKKYNLITVVRKPNKMKAFFKQINEHKVVPNILKRNFNPKENEVFVSTDITELSYLGGQKAYLSAYKDLRNKKIIHYHLSQRPTLELVMTGLDKLLGNTNKKMRDSVIIHSDQGFHYTSYAFREMLKKHGIKQSMSRKGNCLDNAPIESFFGHLKDESEYRKCRNWNELVREIDNYIKYYNDERPQWGLNKKTPAEAGANMNLVF